MIFAAATSTTNATSVLSPSSFGKRAGAGAPEASSPEEQFKAFAQLSPMDRMRASVLSSMGLDQKQLDSMASDERQKVEEVIKQKIKEGFEKNGAVPLGTFADMKV